MNDQTWEHIHIEHATAPLTLLNLVDEMERAQQYALTKGAPPDAQVTLSPDTSQQT